MAGSGAASCRSRKPSRTYLGHGVKTVPDTLNWTRICAIATRIELRALRKSVRSAVPSLTLFFEPIIKLIIQAVERVVIFPLSTVRSRQQRKPDSSLARVGFSEEGHRLLKDSIPLT